MTNNQRDMIVCAAFLLALAFLLAKIPETEGENQPNIIRHWPVNIDKPTYQE
jgi:hypothetical protein